MDDVKTLFTKEKVEIINLDELKRTVSAKDMGSASRTRPVSHFEFIDSIMAILTEAEQAPILDHIYCVKSGGTKIIPKIEEQYGVKMVLEAWLLDKLTGKILLPNLRGAEFQCAIAFSYHEKGIDLAFGTNVHDCSNMNIFGSNVMHTYGKGKDVSYDRMLEVLREWSTHLDAMHAKDLALITSMQMITVTGKEMLLFLGKLLVNAVSANAGFKVVAPLNVSQVNEIVRGVVKEKGEKFYEGEDCTLWEFFNFMTFVMKGDKADITSLLTDISALGEIVIKEFEVQPTIDVVIDDEPF